MSTCAYPSSDRRSRRAQPPAAGLGRTRLRSVSALLSVFLVAVVALLAAEPVEIEILQTTDLHTFLESSDQLPAGGGWLRLAALIRREREVWGADRLLLIDCGDTCQGTLVGLLSRGQVGTDLLRALDYDVWVPGNHELDFGVARCLALCEAMQPRLLCGNLTLDVEGRQHAFRAWRVFDRAGVRVAVIGATAVYLEQWLWGNGMRGYQVGAATELLERVVPELLGEHPDLIVLAIHQGWLEKDPRNVNEIRAIVARFPQIDVILGGHTHRERPGMRLGRSTWYVQAGCNAAHLAAVTVKVDVAEHRLLDVSSRLITAGPEVPVDAASREAIQPWLERSAQAAATPVGALTAPLRATGQPGETCAASELICEAIAAATGSQVVLHGKLSSADLPAGTTTEAHVFSLIPFENTIALAKLTVPEICEIVTEQFASKGSSAYCGIWGLELQATESEVAGVSLAGGKPATDARLLAALNSYTVAGAGGRFPRLREILRRSEAELRDTEINSRDAVRDYLKAHQPYTPHARRWLSPAAVDARK